MRCALGTFWFDGWCLDSCSAGLIVEFQDEQMQTSARDLAMCLAQEGGAVMYLCSRTAHMLDSGICLPCFWKKVNAASQHSVQWHHRVPAAS